MGQKEVFADAISTIVDSIDGYMSFNDIYCFGIILVAIISFYICHRNVRKNIKNLNSFILEKDNIIGELPQKISFGDNIFENNDYLANLWGKYAQYARQNNIQGKVPDISTYFNRFSIVEIPGKRKIAEIVPGILTALGILGTFLGLQHGISSIDPDSAEKLQSGIKILLSGMSIAFVSSIIGIISSTVWSMIDRSMYKSYLNILDKFYTVFNEKYPTITYETILVESLELQKEITESVKHMATDLSLELSQLISNSINETILPNVDQLINKLVSTEFRPAFEYIGGLIENFAVNTSQNQAESLNLMANNFAQELNTLINVEFENLASAIQEISEWQMNTKDTLDALIKELEESTVNQIEINSNTTQMIDRFTGMFDEFTILNNDIGEQINRLNQSVSSMEIISELALDITEKFNTIQEECNTSFVLIQDNTKLLKENWDNSRNSLQEVNDSLENSSRLFADNLREGLESTFNMFDANLSEIVKRLSGTTLEIQQSVEELPAAISLLTQELESSVNKLNTSVIEINSFYKKLNTELTKSRSEVIT